MKNKFLCVALATLFLSGCAGMQEGFERLNQMAIQHAQQMETAAIDSAKKDVEAGHYSGVVRVALISTPAPKTKTSIDHEAALEVIREEFGKHAQIEILNEKDSKRVQDVLRIGASGLTPEFINMRAKTGINAQMIDDVDIILRAGMSIEKYTGINKSTGKIGQGAKIICAASYMTVGDQELSKVQGETVNIFKNTDAVKQAANAFHKDVLDRVMIEKLKRRLATVES